MGGKIKMENHWKITGHIRRKEILDKGLFVLQLMENDDPSFEVVELICNPTNAYSIDSVYKWSASNFEEANKMFEKKLNELKELLLL